VNKVRRVGNGWLGRAATRGRMTSHHRGYVGSEKARQCVYSHCPNVEIRKGLEVEMSENLAEQVIRPSYEQTVGSIRHSGVQEILRRAQEVEDEITEQPSLVTAHVQSGVS
jgi:hypothetical protein